MPRRIRTVTRKPVFATVLTTTARKARIGAARNAVTPV
jgi:hypothetical protein